MLPTHYRGAGGALDRLAISTPSRSQQILGFLNSKRLSRFLPYGFILVIVLWVYVWMMPPELQYPPPHLYPPPQHPVAGSDDHRPNDIAYAKKAEAVREAFIYAYEGYRTYAMPMDELRPLRGTKVNNFNGWGVTMIDSLDTMYLMGLTEYWDEAMGYIHELDFSIPSHTHVPFFETTIRYLGGLLSAFALSGDPLLLQKSDELGAKLLPAFETDKAGFPAFGVSTETGTTRSGWTGSSLWAEIASCQMEYKYLAHLTGKVDYFKKADHVMNVMFDANLTMPGVFPTHWNARLGNPSNQQFSVGAFADSALEYYLKQWLLSSKSEPRMLKLYLETMEAVINKLIFVSPNRGFLYVTDTTMGRPSHYFEHLSCFFPGLIALGLRSIDEVYMDKDTRQLHQWAADGLAHTCWLIYADSKTGLGADEINVLHVHGARNDEGLWVKELAKWKENGAEGVPPGLSMPEPVHSAKATATGLVKVEGDQKDYTYKRGSYLLRPEALESFYVMWKTSGDEIWRERSWAVFQSIEQYAKTPFGYASVQHVDHDTVMFNDEMASFFLAETLKYIYLTFLDPKDDPMPIDTWILNTEAHPLPVFEWTSAEKEKFGVLGEEAGLMDSAFGPGRGKGRFRMDNATTTQSESEATSIDMEAVDLVETIAALDS